MMSRPEHFKRLLRFLRRKGRSREDAEDLIQEAMLRLHVYGREAPVVNEEAFLRHAVHNLSIAWARRMRRDCVRCRRAPSPECSCSWGVLSETWSARKSTACYCKCSTTAPRETIS